MNNCSDIYLVVGDRRALLIDLSNPHDTEAATALRELVSARIGALPLTITATHFHGDHLGMLPAFADAGADFWVSAGEFAERAIFPASKTTWFDGEATLDLGGRLVRSVPLRGHTPHSTGFLLADASLLFTGDALGSGSGVWLFDYDSFLVYWDTVDNLQALLSAPGSGIDTQALRIYSGHTWQYGERSELTLQYVLDMQRPRRAHDRGEIPARDYRVNIRRRRLVPPTESRVLGRGLRSGYRPALSRRVS